MMIQLLWTRHRLWIISGLAILANAAAAVFCSLVFYNYVASHPGSLKLWETYLRLIAPIINLASLIFIIFKTIQAHRRIKEAQQEMLEARARIQQLQEERNARLARLIEQRVRDGQVSVFDPAGVFNPPVDRLAEFVNFVNLDELEMIDDHRTPEQKLKAETKARANLERVTRALNCKPVYGCEEQPTYEFRAKDGTHFIVSPSYIHRYGLAMGDVTCYQLLAPCPRAEKVATAILQLNRNPKIFEIMKANPGRWVS